LKKCSTLSFNKWNTYNTNVFSIYIYTKFFLWIWWGCYCYIIHSIIKINIFINLLRWAKTIYLLMIYREIKWEILKFNKRKMRGWEKTSLKFIIHSMISWCQLLRKINLFYEKKIRLNWPSLQSALVRGLGRYRNIYMVLLLLQNHK
jgi:hypothetical protein